MPDGEQEEEEKVTALAGHPRTLVQTAYSLAGDFLPARRPQFKSVRFV